MHTMELFCKVADAVSRINRDADIEDLNWYPEAHEFARHLSNSYGCTLAQASGVIAAFSTNNAWGPNQKLAESYLAGDGRGMPSVLKKCDAIMATTDADEIAAILFGGTGWKIRSFFWNIYKPRATRNVTIDRWMCRADMLTTTDDDGNEITYTQGQLKGKYGHSTTLYERYQDAVNMVADAMGTTGDTIQELMWVDVRGSAH